MKRRALLLGAVTAAMFAGSAFAAADTHGILGFRWGKNAFDFETLPSQPAPPQNLSRHKDGSADHAHMVGDYHNPILRPYAAAILKKKGDVVIAGGYNQNTQDQCRAMGPPFTLAMGTAVQMMPSVNGDIVIVYDQNANIRHVRMNAAHPAKPVRTAKGDSIGHWEGDVLVVDTVGLKNDAFTAVDRLGTPMSEEMHVIERYHLIDGALAKSQTDAYEKSEGVIGGGTRNAGYDPDTSLKGLQLDLTLEDPKIFTAPLTVRVTYRRLANEWSESVCAENPMEHYKDEWVGRPKATRIDF